MAAPMTKEDKQWLIVALLVGIGIIVAFYMLYYKQATQKYDRLLTQKQELETVVNKYAAIVEGPESQARIQELRERVAQFEQQLPNEKEIPSLLTYLRDIANQSEIEYVSIKADKLKPADFYIEVPFKVNLKGKYHNIGQVINKLETHTRLMKVDAIDIAQGDEPPYKHTISFILSTYVFNPNPTESKT